MEDGQVIPLPPILLGHLGNDPKKKTVCIYGHLDVQPAKKVLLYLGFHSFHSLSVCVDGA